MAAYKIIDVEGIGPVYAEKLLAAGITDTDILLEKCGKPAGRKALAEETGISPKLILTWTNHARPRLTLPDVTMPATPINSKPRLATPSTTIPRLPRPNVPCRNWTILADANQACHYTPSLSSPGLDWTRLPYNACPRQTIPKPTYSQQTAPAK